MKQKIKARRVEANIIVKIQDFTTSKQKTTIN